MQFMDKLAAEAANKFKETSDELWEFLGGPEASQSKTVRASRFSAGKYATLATMVLMMNYPDNATVFRDAFNVTGNGPDGVAGFAATKSVTANRIARALHNTQVISQTLSLEAIRAQGYADITATSTLDDILQMLPVITSPVKPAKGKK